MIKNITLISLFIFLLISTDAYCQVGDSLSSQAYGEAKVDERSRSENYRKKTMAFDHEYINARLIEDNNKRGRVTSSRAYQMLEVPIILTAMGLAYQPVKYEFQAIRDHYTPNFGYTYDDYLQYLPAAVMLGLKASGVESRSSWGHMLTADAFSVAIMAAVVNGVKYTAKIPRPGNSSNNSMPSGHTATAFMTATMMHKEYGHLSPWYSVGAYTAATAVAATRIMRNRHWISDVLVGAAVGIVSVELGYLFADMIFVKPEEKEAVEVSNLYFSKNHKPSFVSIYTGITVNPGNYKLLDGRDVSIETGARVGIEGAWFMNPYIGFGGQAMSSTSLLEYDQQQSLSSLGIITGAAGAYFSYPLSSVWRLGTKALVGFNYANIKPLPNSLLMMDDYNVSFQTGVSISYLAKRNLGFKIFTDYSLIPSFFGDTPSNEFVFGASIDVLF